jgi:hypothetical protein
MLGFLIPFATPLFWIGIAITAAIVLAGIITIIGRGEEAPSSMTYAILDARIRWLIKMLLISLGAVVIGWALPHIDTDPSRPVPTKIVYVQPKPVEIYAECIRHVQEDDQSRASCIRVATAQMELVKRYTPMEVERKIYLIPRLPAMYKDCMEQYDFVSGEGNDAVVKRMAACTESTTKQYNTMVNKYKER